MQLGSILLVALSIVAMVLVCAVQWWALRRAHRRELIHARARHQAVQQSTDTMLQQARRQYAQIQQELIQLRQSQPRGGAGDASRAEAVRAEQQAVARSGLLDILDDEQHAQRRLPVDGFASTLPSQQFPLSSSFDARAPHAVLRARLPA